MAAPTVAGPIDSSSQANEIFDPRRRPMLPYHNNGTATVGAVHDTSSSDGGAPLRVPVMVNLPRESVATQGCPKRQNSATNVIAVASDEAEKAAAATCAAVPVKGGYFFWGSDAHSPAFTRSPAYFNKCMLTLSSVDERGVTTVHGYYPPHYPSPISGVPGFATRLFKLKVVKARDSEGPTNRSTLRTSSTG